MITNRTQSALAPPPMSWLRKMSTKTMMASQIQMTKKKNLDHGPKEIEQWIRVCEHRVFPLLE